jgi:hypothetical protein
VLIALAVLVVTSLLWARSKAHIRVEPFESGKTPKDVASKIESEVSRLKDKLNVATYRDSYEDALMHLDDWANLTLLDLINGADGSTKTMMQLARDFNDVCSFKVNLSTALSNLDKT